MGHHTSASVLTPIDPIDRSVDICTGRAKYGQARPGSGRVKCDRCGYWHAPLPAERRRDPKPRGAKRTHAALRRHPNFSFPAFPRHGGSRVELAEFILESVARFVSPPKIAGEDEEFACEDIAAAIRTKLKPEILDMLQSSTERRGPR